MLKAASIRTCVVYDPANGKIVHVHKETTIVGGTERTDAEIEARARKFAAKPGRDVGRLAAAFVKDTRARNLHHKIDTATIEFVEVEMRKP
jgi:hypothetical protein